jgi:hypothetical protein
MVACGLTTGDIAGGARSRVRSLGFHVGSSVVRCFREGKYGVVDGLLVWMFGRLVGREDVS